MKKYCFGIDVGGTTVKIGFFKTEGILLEKWEIPTRTEEFGRNVLGDICDSLEDKLAHRGIRWEDVEGIGIGLPGPVLEDGTVLQCVNLGWGTFNVAQKLSMMFHGIKVKAGNDANVAALGEAWQGGGKDYDDIVMITLGTGVGGGVVIGGKILTGYNGGAGEIGHMHMEDEEKAQCNCGRKGCLEQYASATGVVRLAKRYMDASDAETKMRELGDEITSKDVFDLAKAGDEGANQVVKKMGSYLGKAMSSIAAVVNPQAFIIGGGVSKAGQFLIDAISDVYRETCFAACGDAAVNLAELGNDAGMYGSAALIVKSE
ncbi:MAG: ROK family glucokinase [Eubacterium sp.]